MSDNDNKKIVTFTEAQKGIEPSGQFTQKGTVPQRFGGPALPTDQKGLKPPPPVVALQTFRHC